MAPVTEGKRTAEFLISEANSYRSRDEVTVTVPASTTIAAGTIMGVITASGKYVAHDESASDGSENPAAILFDNLTNDTGGAVDVSATVVIRDCEVRAASLTHDPAANPAAIADDLEDLAALGIIAR